VEQHVDYLDRRTRKVTGQVVDEQPQSAISIAGMRSLGKLQLLSSVMVTSGTLINNPRNARGSTSS
jgi:hypothetical protein